ncbi:MAG TPA: protein kinase, partial [Kofleriaceae bacterium]
MTPHDRLSELFLEAVDLDSTERGSLIARVRIEDAALATKLIAMLAADADVATALRDDDTATARTVAGSPAAIVQSAAPLIPGFRVTGVLGDGGMGTVYAGEQEAPRRPVAIKVLAARSPGARIRFVAESEIMARLDHPGIARVLGAGEVDGELWLAMERVDGVTFDRVARPLGERLAMFAAICDAVHH